MVVGQRPRAGTHENLHLKSTNKRLGKRHTGSNILWNLKACPQWDTFSNETTSPNPFKPLHRLGTKYPNTQAYGVILSHTPHDLSTSLITLLSDSTRNGTRPSRSCHYASRREGLHPLSFLKQLVGVGLHSLQQGVLSTAVQGFPVGAEASSPQLMQKWRTQWKKRHSEKQHPENNQAQEIMGWKTRMRKYLNPGIKKQAWVPS